MDNHLIIQTFFEGKWHDGNHPILRAADHATWLGTLCFDGARRFGGHTPDLDLHCNRLIKSAEAMGLHPNITGAEIFAIVKQGLAAIDPQHDLYIRPMMWSVECGPGVIEPVPESIGFAICLEEMPMPEHVTPMKLAISAYRRPTLETAIVNAKAAALYANSARIMADARRRGFHNALVLDILGNVAETSSTNLFIVKDGMVKTPIPNGSFLAGITRARAIKLLRDYGVEVQECTLKIEDFMAADEAFSTANMSKIVPISHLEDRAFPTMEIGLLARQLYWEWAKTTSL